MTTKLLGLLAFMSLLGFSPASADTIYTYMGNDFTSISGSYTSTEMVTGTIDLATALGDNFGLGPISPVSYSFSDGQQTLTNTNSYISNNLFETDSAGTIDQWLWGVFNPLLYTSQIDTYNTSGLIVEDAVFTPTSLAFNLGNPGTWTTSVATTPLPAALPLFASGLGVIVVLGRQRKRKIGAPRAA
ncbi:MAG: VPLPA-CTERM sorting domain-containing protein [Xanthobacteraceae bacterium]|jgi:hypothetical protein